MKKILGVILIVTMIISMMTACGGKTEKTPNNKKENSSKKEVTSKKEADKNVKIVVWHQYEENVESEIKSAFEKFTKNNPNIQVEFLKQVDLAKKLTLIGQSQEDAPDIVLGPNDWAGRYAAMGIFTKVTDLVDKKIFEDHIPATVDAVTVNGTKYGVPITFECLTFMYNKKLLDKAPKTTDELLKLMEQNTKGDKWGFVTNTVDAYFSMPWIYGFNGYAIDDKGVPGLNQEGTKEAMKFVKQMNKYIPKDIDYNVMDGLFKEGKALSIMNGSWAVKGYMEDKNIDLGVEILPVISKTGKSAQPFLGVQAAFVSATSNKKESIGKVLEFISGVEIAKAFARSGYLVSNKKIDLSDDPIAEKLSKQATLAIPMPAIPEMSAVWEPLAKSLIEIKTNQNANIDKLMEKAQKEAIEKIEETK